MNVTRNNSAKREALTVLSDNRSELPITVVRRSQIHQAGISSALLSLYNHQAQ